MSDRPKNSRMMETLGLLQPGKPQPAPVKKADEQHPIECRCCECEARRGICDVKAFAASREALKDPIPPQAFYPGAQRPTTLPRRPRHGDEQPTSFEGLAREADIMSMAAQALPKGGRPKKWSTGELFRLLSEVAEIQTECPEMNNKEALKRYAENKGLSTSIKDLQNQLSTARKRFPKG